MKNLTFYGIDASNKISLLEYGLLVSNEKHEDNSGTQFCIYRIDTNSFGCGHFSELDINNLLNGNDWMNTDDINSFFSFVGSTKEEYLTCNLATKLCDLIQYFGSENICGTDYDPMTEKEAIQRYL